jgi:hypothetical protein
MAYWFIVIKVKIIKKLKGVEEVEMVEDVEDVEDFDMVLGTVPLPGGVVRSIDMVYKG